MTVALELTNLTVRRGGLEICRNVSLRAPAGEITVLLGANGAGKSTLLDAVAGVLPAIGGSVTIGGQPLNGLSPHRRVRRGLAYVEQGRTVFAGLTVEQNLRVVTASSKKMAYAYELFPQLGRKRGTVAGLLSGGEQQMLVIARALVTDPQILLIDELSLGLAPQVVDEVVGVLSRLVSAGLGILLVEQFVDTALSAGEMAYTLAQGEITRVAPCAVLRRERDRLITEQYLGDAAG